MKRLISWRFQLLFLIVFLFIPYRFSFVEASQTGWDQNVVNSIPSWNTFLGSGASDSGYAVATDPGGNVYIAGSSDATWGTPLNPHSGGTDAFVVKLNSSGQLQWSTFLGSTKDDQGYTVAVDGSGNVYIAGESEATWGTPLNPYMGDFDAYIAKLDTDGILQWNTFLGSISYDIGFDVNVDGSGNVYIGGLSSGTWGSPVNPHAGGVDAFVAKLNGSGTLQWNTFMGSSDLDYCTAISEDGTGNIYAGGFSYSTWGTPINPHTGTVDAYAAKLDSSGVRLWNTFMGSTGGDRCTAVAVDGGSNLFVVGFSSNTWGSPVNPHTAENDAFVAKLSGSGILQWNTFMGSLYGDFGYGIDLDGSGNIYVGGFSEASWGTPIAPYTGGHDVFTAVLNSSGVRLWHAFMGSTNTDKGKSLTVDVSGSIYVAGDSDASWGTPIDPFAGSTDAFVAKIAKEPEINVRFGGINFADGSTRNLGTRHSSFIMGREFTFTIENLGTSQLNLTGSPMVALSGPQAEHFYISQQPTSPVPAFGTTTFKLRTVRDSLPGFLPIGWTYPVSITVNIPNDDADENPYDFTINFTLEKDS